MTASDGRSPRLAAESAAAAGSSPRQAQSGEF